VLYKVCNQVITPLPWRQSTAAMHERKVIPVDTKEFRYLRFRAIGNMEVAGQNGNHDGFGFSDFQDARPGYGYKSFIGKKAHVEHNSSEGLAGSIGDLPDAYLNSFELGGLTAAKLWKELDGSKNASLRQQILALPNQRDGAIEVMMRIDTKLIKSAEVKPKVRQLLDRIVRMIDTGQQLTCSMGANIAYSVCSTCGNEARFSNQYCIHLKPTHKGGITIAKANDLRDLLDKDLLRPEWLSHTVASKFDVNEILTGSSNKGIACRNIEINHEVSFFELSVVAMPAYAEAIVLEKLARKQDETPREHLRRLASEFGDDEVLELYAILQDRGLIGNSCMVG
jgi:hypothetical protein